MTFTTLSFAAFLAIVFSAYWSLGRRGWQNILIVAASYVFYAWWDYRFCGLMLLTCLTDFTVGALLGKTSSTTRRKILLAISLTVDLGVLGFFKYYNFFIESFSSLLASAGFDQSTWTLRIILPVGISFYTFQSLSYTIDVYRRKMEPTGHLVDFMAFVSFFPQLVAGPIERASRLLPQFQRERTFNYEKAVDGCRLMLWGIFKKLYFADALGRIVEPAYADPTGTHGLQLGFASVCFAFQIYCDFSAYSDIATGTARLLGFDLMRNFAFPYFSQNLVEFWRRWHISLSTWFRDYVYIPLGGNRSSCHWHAFSVMATFVLSGLWHGAAWTFVAWGAVHGFCTFLSMCLRKASALRATDTPGGETVLPSLSVLARIMATFAIVTMGWVLFRAENISVAWTVLSRTGWACVDPQGWAAFFHEFKGWGWLTRLAIFVLVEWFTRRETHPLALNKAPKPVRWLVYTVLLWMALMSMELDPSAFIYFQF